ncbi:MAG: RimK/LysX family protein [Candidatus Saccharibacteria bacterium]
MKLTIIAESNGLHPNDLKLAAERKGINTSIIDVSSLDITTKKINSKLGDAVIWRSSGLDIRAERPSLKPILKDKIVVSDCVFESPLIYQKFYQQQILRQEPATSKWSIPTFRFVTKKSFVKAIDAGLLSFPVILKPNAGSRGEGIVLVKNLNDINQLKKIKQYVCQNYIKNNGDWRIIVIGGSPVGVLLRKGKSDQFINNISQGADGSVETDAETLTMLRKISTKVASLFHSNFCGVDIIRDSATGEYFVLELNTAPQWFGDQGFQSITGVGVADLVTDWIVDRAAAKEMSVCESVESYYKSRISQIPSEAFHFASRLWLWTGDDWAREQLDILKVDYIGNSPEEIDLSIREIINGAGKTRSVNQRKAYRNSAYEKYDKLSIYNALLFKTVFCDSIYDLDIRPYIKKYISDEDFIGLFNNLIDDGDSIRLLSTHAINFMYLLKNYFKNKISLSSLVLVSTSEITRLLGGYKKLEQSGIIDKRNSVKLQIYLLTHAIIGQSRFYARNVKSSEYTLLCKKVERIIKDNYFDISLDNKLEFLVCSQVCGYDTELRQLIEQEAEKSVSWAGNFLVDTLCLGGGSKTGHCLRISEHRNVLYLMSQKDFVQNKSKKQLGPKGKLPTIGRLARVKMQDYGIRRAIARVDSGATNSSIAASNVRVEGDKLHFILFYKGHPMYTGDEFVSDNFKAINVRNTTSEQGRYAVVLKFELGEKKYKATFNLADRQQMIYPILLGRDFLMGRYKVDTSKQFVEGRRKKKEGNKL